MRPRDANPIDYAGLYAAEQQRTAYPDIGPLARRNAAGRLQRGARGGDQAQVARRRRAPAAGRPRREGRIEAVARTPIMGFRDDVVVRVRADDDGARIDVRSSSRYGAFDFGTNAARIRGSIDDIEDAHRATAEAGERPPNRAGEEKSRGVRKRRRIESRRRSVASAKR